MSLKHKETVQQQKHDDFCIENNPLNEIKRTIAALSGKGALENHWL